MLSTLLDRILSTSEIAQPFTLVVIERHICLTEEVTRETNAFVPGTHMR